MALQSRHLWLAFAKIKCNLLKEIGIKAVYLGDVQGEGWKDVEKGMFSLVYASPEMLLDNKGSEIDTNV